jgi:tetratricopeptide (TPR) repeat protein
MRLVGRLVVRRAQRSASSALQGRAAEARALANSFLREEQWLSAVAPLEAIRAAEGVGSDGWRRASAELALCLQSQNRAEEAGKLYDAALHEEGGWDGAAVALLNYAELRGTQERWPEAEGLARRGLALLESKADQGGARTATAGAARSNVAT